MNVVLILAGTHFLVLAAGVYLGDKFNPLERLMSKSTDAVEAVKDHLEK